MFARGGLGYNRTPAAVYLYRNGAWRKVGAAADADFGGVTLNPGEGFIIRKAATSTDLLWTFLTGF